MTKKKALILEASTRQETGKQVAALRINNFIPAVLYGHKIENQNLSVKYSDFEKVLNEAGESTLIDLKIDNQEPSKVLIHAFDRDAVSHRVNHVDFYQVNMKEKIKTEVELNFIGESPAVKNLSGVLVKVLDKVEIECLPGNLVSHFDVDLSKLETFDDVLRVKDLAIPENVVMLTDMEGAIALIEEPKKVEEIEEETVEGEVATEEAGEEGGEKEEKDFTKEEGKDIGTPGDKV